MPLLLRKVGSITDWVPWDELHRDAEFSWLQKGEHPADAIADLKTTSNKLSLWEVDDRRDNLPDILVAIALANANHPLGDINYVLFEREDLANACPNLERTPGETPHKRVNKLYHWELSCLCGTDLLTLVDLNTLPERWLPRDLLPHIDRAIEAKEIKAPKENTELARSLEQLRAGVATVRTEAV